MAWHWKKEETYSNTPRVGVHTQNWAHKGSIYDNAEEHRERYWRDDTCNRAFQHIVTYHRSPKSCKWKICFCILVAFVILSLKNLAIHKSIRERIWGPSDDIWIRNLEQGEPPYGNKDFATSVRMAYFAAAKSGLPYESPTSHSYLNREAHTLGDTRVYRKSSAHAVSMLVRYAAEHLHKRYHQETKFPKFPSDTHYLRLASFYSTRASDFRRLAERASDVATVMGDEEYEAGRSLKIPLGNNYFISTPQVWCAHKTATAMYDALNHLKEVLEERNYAHLDTPFERPVPVELLIHPGEDIHEVLRDATGVNKNLLKALVAWEETAASLPLWFHDAFSKTLFMENFSTMKDTAGSPEATQRQNEILAARQAMSGLVSVEEGFIDWIFSPQNVDEDKRSLALRKFVIEATLRSHKRRMCIWVHNAENDRRVAHLTKAAALMLDDAFMLQEILESIHGMCSEISRSNCVDAASPALSSLPLEIPDQQQNISYPFLGIQALIPGLRNEGQRSIGEYIDIAIRPKESVVPHFDRRTKTPPTQNRERLAQTDPDIIHARSISLSKRDIDVLLRLLRSQAHAARAVMQVIRGIPADTLGTELHSDEIFAKLLNRMPESDILVDAMNTAYPVITSLPSFLKKSLLTLIPLSFTQTLGM